MRNYQQEASDLIREAEKKIFRDKGFLWSIFGYRRNRTDEAINCYQRAGHLFRLSKNWIQAGSAYKTAADLSLGQDNRIEAAGNYALASKCLKKHNTNNAINMSLSAIQIYTDLGRFVMAAKQHKEIAEMYEDNLELEKAVQHYEQSAEYFKADDSYASAKSSMLKVANYSSSEFHNYTKAIQIYQEIAFHDLKVPILKYNAKDSLLKAVLCHLCIDILNAKHALDLYVSKYPEFESTYQFRFLRSIIDAIEDSEEDHFNAAVMEYDRIFHLDTWFVKILLQVKKLVKGYSNLL